MSRSYIKLQTQPVSGKNIKQDKRKDQKKISVKQTEKQIKKHK